MIDVVDTSHERGDVKEPLRANNRPISVLYSEDVRRHFWRLITSVIDNSNASPEPLLI